jgi:hypothetical protein
MKLVRRKGDEFWRQWDPKQDDCMDADVEVMDVEPVALANRVVELESELESVRLAFRQKLTMRQRMFKECLRDEREQRERGDA